MTQKPRNSSDGQDIRVSEVSIEGEPSLDGEPNQGTFPWKVKFTLRFKVTGKLINDEQWTTEISKDYEVPPGVRRPIKRLKVTLRPKSYPLSPSSDFEIEILPDLTNKIPRKIEIDFRLRRNNERNTDGIGQHFLDVRIPIRHVPVRNDDFDANDLYHDLHLVEGERPYTYIDLFKELEKRLKSHHDGPIVNVVPAIWWIRGGIARGKSTFIHKLRGLLVDCKEWCVVDLTGFPNHKSPSIETLHKHVYERLAACIRYEVESDDDKQPSERAYCGANDIGFQRHIAECYGRIIQQKHQGVVYILDEFDVLWSPSPDDATSDSGSESITADNLLHRLLWIMSIAPSSIPGHDSVEAPLGNMPVVLLLSDYLLPAERTTSSFKNKSQEDSIWFSLQADARVTHSIQFDQRVFELYGAFTTTQIREMVLSLLPPFRLDAHKDEQEAIVDRIYVWTRGHPACVKLLLHRYFSYCRDRPNRPSISEMIETELDSLYDDVKYLTEEAEKVWVEQRKSLANTGWPGSSRPRTIKRVIARMSQKERDAREKRLSGKALDSDASIELLISKGIFDPSGKLYNLLLGLRPRR